MCCFCPKFCIKLLKTLNKECFSKACPHTSFFHWLIVLWIFLIVIDILIYGILLIEMVTLKDDAYSKSVQNIVIQVLNGLFTFAAVLNLPVRLKRLGKLYGKRRDSGVVRVITLGLFPSSRDDFTQQNTEAWELESQLIFERLAWGTQHLIIQALLWNSLFQIINQVCRCIYYSYELADTSPGNILVNTFFPLAILTSLIAAFTQAVAENRFREKQGLCKKPNNLKKTLVEFWYNLWKDQTEGQQKLGIQFEAAQFRAVSTALIDLRQRTVGATDREVSKEDCTKEKDSQPVLLDIIDEKQETKDSTDDSRDLEQNPEKEQPIVQINMSNVRHSDECTKKETVSLVVLKKTDRMESL